MVFVFASVNDPIQEKEPWFRRRAKMRDRTHDHQGGYNAGRRTVTSDGVYT